MSNKKKPMTPRTARSQGREGGSRRPKRSKETVEERMLREGGWRPVIINPGFSDPHCPPLVLFQPPNGKGLFTKDEAVDMESRKPSPSGEMLEPVKKGSKVPHDLETGIPWIWGVPPEPKPMSKREMGRRQSVCRMGRKPRTGEPIKLNRAWRRRNLQRGDSSQG